MKKTLLRLLFGILAGIIIFSSLSLVSASSELCRGVDGYYGDCSYEPWRYQGTGSSASSSASAASGSFRGGNAEVYQFNRATRDNKPSNYANYYSPSYPISTGAMPYFTGGYAGYNQYYDGYGMYDYGLGYGGYGYDMGYGYDSYGYGGYGNYGGFGNNYGAYGGYGSYGYPGYGSGGYGYGYGSNGLNYGLGIASQYATPEGRQWLGVASMIQQFFWL